MSLIDIHMEDPVVIARAPVDVRGWGFWQFPEVEQADNGDIHVRYHISKDSVTAYGSPKGHSISKDGGITWEDMKDFKGFGLKAKNGDSILMHTQLPVDLREVELPEPVTETLVYGIKMQYFRKEDLPEEYGQWTILRKKKGETEFKIETVKMDLPGNALVAVEGMLAKNMMWRLRPMPDGRVCAMVYRCRIVDGKKQKFSAQFLVSGDSGYTWKLEGEIPYEFEPGYDDNDSLRGGFTEPDIAFLPDGSAFCLLRTTDGYGPGPMYWSKSTDGLKTWSKPKIFDKLGVWPELLTLDSGITVASYGRPGLFLRATDDPAGLKWDEPVVIIDPESYGFQKDTCSYSAMTALCSNSALLVYSDFNYPDENNIKRKTILARKITFG